MGGLIGKIDTSSNKSIQIKDSYSKGIINGEYENGGGLIGSITSISGATISLVHLYSDVELSTKGDTVGGAVGYISISVTSNADVNYCFWKKDIAPGEVLNGVGKQTDEGWTFSFIDASHK